MRARSLLAWAAAALVLSLGTEDPVYRLLVLGAAILVFLARRRKDASVGRVVVWVAGAAALAVAFNFALSHTGQTVLLSLPAGIPAVGGPLTLEGLVFGADIAVGLAAALMAAAVLGQGLETQELLEALPAWLHRTAAALGAALTLLPRLGSAFLTVREAQAMRGWRSRGPRSWRAVAVPALLTAMEGSVQLAEAMEARGFGGGRRTKVWTPAASVADWATLLASALAVGIAVAALALGGQGGWQPYPALQLPGVSWPPVLAATLLLVPALWR